MNRRPPQPREREAPRRSGTPTARPVRKHARREWRDRNRRKPDVMALIRSGLVLLLIAQCLRVAFTSPRLELSRVEVRGTERFSPKQVAELGHVELGQNMFRVNLSRVAQQLEKEPLIRDATVTRQLPNTLQVELKERAPALQLASAVAPGAWFQVDEDGVVFQKVTQPNLKLPQAEIAPKLLPKVGGSLRPDLTAAIQECAELARREKLTVSKIRVDEPEKLWLNVVTPASPSRPAGSLAVFLGRATDLPAKFQDIRNLLQSSHSQVASAEYLNVMTAGHPSYRQAKAEPSTSRREP